MEEEGEHAHLLQQGHPQELPAQRGAEPGIAQDEAPPDWRGFSGIIQQIEDAPERFVGTSESYPLEFARGIVASTLPNATLPFSVAQLAQAVVLKVT